MQHCTRYRGISRCARMQKVTSADGSPRFLQWESLIPCLYLLKLARAHVRSTQTSCPCHKQIYPSGNTWTQQIDTASELGNNRLQWEISWKKTSRKLPGDSRHLTRCCPTIFLAPNYLWLRFKRNTHEKQQGKKKQENYRRGRYIKLLVIPHPCPTDSHWTARQLQIIPKLSALTFW